MKVLAGDVGGTHTRLAICEVTNGKVLRLVEEIHPSQAHESFPKIVRRFMADHRADVRAVCFGLPGPVRGRRAELTNLPWVVDADELERDLGLPPVLLLNDLEANAHGLATLSEADFAVVREGSPSVTGNAGLVSAGTGLGEAGMVWDGRTLRPFATEGGHCDFAPRTELEIELLRWLQGEYGPHVSWERVVSGPGLTNIYRFLRSKDPGAQPKWLAEELESGDPNEAITRNALEGKSELCLRAVELFLELYGAEAGNLALKVLATRGIYLGGGIIPRMTALIASSKLVARFDDKGRMKRLVEHIPIRIVLNDKAALQGAALHAARHAGP